MGTGAKGACAAVLVLGVVLSTPGDAAPSYFILPYWKGNVNVYVGANKTVKTTCNGDVNQIAACEGMSCTNLASYPCSPYGCASDHYACNFRCISDADCAQGAVCNTLRGECATVFSGTCEDPFTIKNNSGQLMSCRPYRCVAAQCQQQCVADRPGDCAPGYKCRRSSSTGRYNCYEN